MNRVSNNCLTSFFVRLEGDSRGYQSPQMQVQVRIDGVSSNDLILANVDLSLHFEKYGERGTFWVMVPQDIDEYGYLINNRHRRVAFLSY